MVGFEWGRRGGGGGGDFFSFFLFWYLLNFDIYILYIDKDDEGNCIHGYFIQSIDSNECIELKTLLSISVLLFISLPIFIFFLFEYGRNAFLYWPFYFESLFLLWPI
jgi:hypothetical protein